MGSITHVDLTPDRAVGWKFLDVFSDEEVITYLRLTLEMSEAETRRRLSTRGRNIPGGYIEISREELLRVID